MNDERNKLKELQASLADYLDNEEETAPALDAFHMILPGGAIHKDVVALEVPAGNGSAKKRLADDELRRLWRDLRWEAEPTNPEPNWQRKNVRLSLAEEMHAQITRLLGGAATPGEKLKQCEEKAYGQYRLACEQNPDLTDKAAYQYIKENLLDEGERLPSCETWRKYVRTARTAAGQRKNQPRAGRSGRSIVRASDL